MEEINGLLADIEEAKRKLQDAMLAAAELRKRAYSYLVSALSGGARDPKLIDCGLRQRFDSGRSRSSLAFVEEPEPEPQE